jgi:hypothetical protein
LRKHFDYRAWRTATPTHEKSLKATCTLNPFAVVFRYDEEMQSSLSRQELASMLSSVLEWADRKMASAPPAG